MTARDQPAASHRPWTTWARLREWVALKIAPWLYVPYPEAREDAFRELALVAYGSRYAVWTSPGVLVKVALDRAREEGRRRASR